MEENTNTNQAQQATQNPHVINLNLPIIYTNGILVGMSAADIQLTLTINGRPTNIVAMTMSSAKSLQKSLERAITDYQVKTKTSILEIDEVANLLNTKI